MKKLERVILLFLMLISLLQINVMAEETLETKASLQCDVNGDGKKENIYIKGNWEECKLIIKDSTNKKILQGKNFGEGYDGIAYLKVADFNNDGIKDIFVNLFQEGSGCFNWCGVYSFKNNKLSALKSLNKYEEIGLTTSGVDMTLLRKNQKYYVQISSTWSKKKYILDISENPSIDDDYMVGNGQGRPDGIGDYNNDGKTELVLSKAMCGNSHGDCIAELNVYFTYKDGKWIRLGYDIETKYPIVDSTQE